MAEDLGEKTEDATPKRLLDARGEGNIARSTDAAGALVLLGVTIMLWLGMMPMLGQMKLYMGRSLGSDGSGAGVAIESVRDSSIAAFLYAVKIGAPLLIVAWILSYLSHFWQVGWLFAPKSVQPKLSKLNPISGFQRIFGIAGVVKAAMDAAKVALVVVVVVVSIGGMIDTIVSLPNLGMMQALGASGWLLLNLALRILVVLVALGLIDFTFQRWKHRRDLRMSKTEVKDELKQTEGDPETKKRRMRMQQQIAMQRLSADVPKADVVVTNPEHISVAIQYDSGNMHAPKVVAKGQDYVALRIRQIAMQHGIPVIERKPLARAIYKNVKVGQEIPPQFYQAIAEILAYVYRLSGKMAG